VGSILNLESLCNNTPHASHIKEQRTMRGYFIWWGTNMTFRKTLPRSKWWAGLFWFQNEQAKKKRSISQYPYGLEFLYLFVDGTIAAFGSITWTGTPTIGADGVVAGDGPSMGTIARGGGKVLALRIKMTKASTGITGDEQIYGPLYARNGNLVAKLDGVEATHAHSWATNAVLDVRVEAKADGSLTVEDF
jgi:hypothetical protein